MDNIFVPNADINIDFASEMPVVYTYTSEYIRNIKIDDIPVDGQKLGGEASLTKASHIVGVGDAVSPFQRYVVLKLKKMDITTTAVVMS